MNALEKANEALGSLTPLKTNCGKYCGGACCEPDESGENGMLLLPGEEAYYAEPIEGFPFRLIDDDTLFEGGKRFVCEGICSREHRPSHASCFRFALTPTPSRPSPTPEHGRYARCWNAAACAG